MQTRRPRVAEIGLPAEQRESISYLCGTPRPADSLRQFEERFNLIETDVMVTGANLDAHIERDVPHLLAIEPTRLCWLQSSEPGVTGWAKVSTDRSNTERELTVPSSCPDRYRTLAADLSKQLRRAPDPPATIQAGAIVTTLADVLVETTSGRPVAMRLTLSGGLSTDDREASDPIALFLPGAADLSAWFAAFLGDVHEIDPARVPQPPPRIANPSDWHTPQEAAISEQISAIEHEIEGLREKRERLESELVAEGERANRGIRRAVFADGDDLVEAVVEILKDLGFAVDDVDAGLEQGEPKREDLRLTLVGRHGWEAVVEVKGYTGGTKTNDSDQVRKHRERYIAEHRRAPDLTLWITNPHRLDDPSARPSPQDHVRERAEAVEAVHVLSAELYRQWVLVKTNKLDAQDAIDRLTGADPGLWAP